MAAKKITLEFKLNTCKICENADQRALRNHLPHCQTENPRNRNGHCTEFVTTKSKRSGRAKAGVSV